MTVQSQRAAQLAQEHAPASRLMAQGRRNSGKTELVRARVASLLGQGADPARVCVVAGSDAAVQAMADVAAAGVTVTCARDLELGILSGPEAQAFTRRRPRLILPFEDDFVKEDLKTTGVAAKQLKGMLGFFCKSLTDLSADDPHFFWEKDEQTVFDLARTALCACGPIHPSELSAMCLHYLQTLDDPAGRFGFDHIVADDYQALNRASQLVLEGLATKSLWACADSLDRSQGADPFPHPEGIEEFCAHEGTVRVSLPDPEGAGVAAAAARLASCGFLDALSLGLLDSRGESEAVQTYDVPCASEPCQGVALLECNSWKDEFAQVAAYVKAKVDAGARPGGIVVAAPNLTWARSLSRALRAAGLPVRRMASGPLVSANFRHMEECAQARLVCLLGLVADDGDGMAWRAWCGMGDYVAASNVFVELMTHDCAEGGRTLVEALESLVAAASQGEVGPSHAAVAEAYLAGRRMLDELAGLTGRDLLEAATAKVGLRRMDEALLDACLAPGPRATAAQMRASIQTRATGNAFHGPADAVGVCLFDGTAGLTCEHLVIAGCMNGWLPEHAYFDAASASAKRRQDIDREARSLLYTLAGAATESLAVSSFADVDLEVSERLNLKGYRVSAGEDGRRHMSVRRSVIADYALAALGVVPLDEADLRRQVRPY